MNNMFRVPIAWKYGAVAAGAGLTQGFGMLWFSRNVMGPVWQRELPLSSVTLTDADKQKNTLIGLAADVAVGFVLNYLASRYFRPVTVGDAVGMAAILGALQLIPQISHMLWEKRSFNAFAVAQTYNVVALLIKCLCLTFIPY